MGHSLSTEGPEVENSYRDAIYRLQGPEWVPI